MISYPIYRPSNLIFGKCRAVVDYGFSGHGKLWSDNWGVSGLYFTRSDLLSTPTEFKDAEFASEFVASPFSAVVRKLGTH